MPIDDRLCDLCGQFPSCGWAWAGIGHLTVVFTVCDACEMRQVIGTADLT